MTPRRIQRRRTAGWRLPEGAVIVDRTTRWGNPFRHDGTNAGRATAGARFRLDRHSAGYPSDDEVRRELAGKDLVCWCPLGVLWCHADALLRVANGEVPSV